MTTYYRIDPIVQDDARYVGLVDAGWVVPVDGVLMTCAEWLATIDPEDVLTEYLVKRGIPKDDAWMASHQLVHTVLYCLSRPERVVDAALGADE